jgi:hypothetical protein
MRERGEMLFTTAGESKTTGVNRKLDWTTYYKQGNDRKDDAG